MVTHYFKDYSAILDREMEMKVYGHAGRPALFIPCQDGRFFDFENFHMADVMAPWIESGQIMVFSIDTMDAESWSNTYGDPYWRIRRYEQWIHYIVEEVVPFIQDWTRESNQWDEIPGVMVFGASLGATHAVNLFLRFPEQFDRLLALSGIYTTEYGFGSYMDDVTYMNSPVHYLANMPADHPYIQLYNQKKGVICVGQGAWEEPETTRRIAQLCAEKDIHLWVDFWGWDVKHDWPWWYKQVEYFLPYLLDD